MPRDHRSKRLSPLSRTTLAGVCVLTSVSALSSMSGCEGLAAPEPIRGSGTALMTESTQPTQEQANQIDAAKAAQESGDYEVALDILQDVIAENPTITEAFLSVGDIYLETEDYEKAEPAYRRAARLEPRNFRAQYGLGLALQMLNRYAEAVQVYHKALTINPDDFRANLEIATAYLELNDADKARTFAERAVSIDPASGPARVNLGAICERLGNPEQAVEHYIAAVEILGNEPPLVANLVSALAGARRYREAANTAQTLVRIDPSPNAWERLGYCYFKLREYDESQNAYRSAVELDPDHWPSLNGIGVNALNQWLLSERNDETVRRLAREAFRRSLRVNPEQDRIVGLLINYNL